MQFSLAATGDGELASISISPVCSKSNSTSLSKPSDVLNGLQRNNVKYVYSILYTYRYHMCRIFEFLCAPLIHENSSITATGTTLSKPDNDCPYNAMPAGSLLMCRTIRPIM